MTIDPNQYSQQQAAAPIAAPARIGDGDGRVIEPHRGRHRLTAVSRTLRALRLAALLCVGSVFSSHVALAGSGGPKLAPGATVDANKASAAELQMVKGVGPAMSTKILDARKTGPFRDWHDLVDRVSGIGPGSAGRLSQAGLTVGGAAYGANSAVAPSGSPRAATTPAPVVATAAPAAAGRAASPAPTTAVKSPGTKP